jgi:hypothetical protein
MEKRVAVQNPKAFVSRPHQLPEIIELPRICAVYDRASSPVQAKPNPAPGLLATSNTEKRIRRALAYIKFRSVRCPLPVM